MRSLLLTRAVDLGARFCAALAMLLLAGTAAGQTDTRTLDDLLRRNASRALAEALRKVPDDDRISRWLAERATEGHVVPQYELALRQSTSDAASAMKWFAVARLNHRLDERECADRRAAGSVESYLNVRFRFLEQLSDREELAFADGMDAALKEPIAERGKQPPWWICAEGNASPDEAKLLPEPQRAQRRKEQWDLLYASGLGRSMEARFNANLNPDGFRIWRLDEKYWKGRYSDSSSTLPGGWIDEDTLLFGGYSSEVEGRTVYYPIYLWNLASGNVREYMGPSANGLCYFKGYVSYQLERDGKWVRFEGDLGREKELEYVPREKWGEYDYFQCRRIPKSESPHKVPFFALESGGYFAGTDLTRKKRAEFRAEGSDKTTAFDLFEGIEEVPYRLLASGPRYSEFLNASWIHVETGTVRTTMPQRAWVLFPDGRVTKHDFAPGPWASSGSVFFAPAKPGWVVGSAARGVYLLEGGTPRKLLAGRMKAMRVSASGCRVAVMIWELKVGNPLWVIDVCKKGDRK